MSITLRLYMLPASGDGRVRSKDYDRVDNWGFIDDGTLLVISQGDTCTYIPWHRIDKIVEINNRVLKVVK